MKFQTYIQRRYFKKIIENANQRLYTMSNHQFILQCRDLEDLGAQGQVGLIWMCTASSMTKPVT